MRSMLDDEMMRLDRHESGMVVLEPEEAEKLSKRIEGLRRKLDHVQNMSEEEKEMLAGGKRIDP